MDKLFKDDRCYRPDEVAKILSIDIKTVYRRIKDLDNPFPCFRLKNHGPLRLPGNKMNKFLEDNKVDPLEE